MMGPDCGTAILNGKPLAFANVVRRGPIGIVGAAGTGIQEVSSCIDRLGGGVSQAIGTGGRDLSDAVGGLMMLLGIESLAADPETRVLVVVSKPPSPAVAEKVVAALGTTRKPCVVHFVGDQKTAAGGESARGPAGRAALTDSPARAGAGAADDAMRGIVFADSLAGAAEMACRRAGVPGVPAAPPLPDAERVAELAARLQPGVRLRGLFCGGTTGQEALVLLGRAGLQVRSNLHKKGPLRIEGTTPVRGHALLDLGDDVFTVGRPHPMIEPALRNERLALETADPEVALRLFDCVLGFGSHPDPAGVLAEGVEEARAGARGRPLVAIASVTGTPGDPQDYHGQVRSLTAAGIIVEPDNRQAAALAAAVLKRIG
jgi:succinyl-CoA synthetase alpha subunit